MPVEYKRSASAVIFFLSFFLSYDHLPSTLTLSLTVMDAPALQMSHRAILDHHMLEVRGKAAEDDIARGKKFVEIWVRSPSNPF